MVVEDPPEGPAPSAPTLADKDPHVRRLSRTFGSSLPVGTSEPSTAPLPEDEPKEAPPSPPPPSPPPSLLSHLQQHLEDCCLLMASLTQPRVLNLRSTSVTAVSAAVFFAVLWWFGAGSLSLPDKTALLSASVASLQEQVHNLNTTLSACREAGQQEAAAHTHQTQEAMQAMEVRLAPHHHLVSSLATDLSTLATAVSNLQHDLDACSNRPLPLDSSHVNVPPECTASWLQSENGQAVEAVLMRHSALPGDSGLLMSLHRTFSWLAGVRPKHAVHPLFKRWGHQSQQVGMGMGFTGLLQMF